MPTYAQTHTHARTHSRTNTTSIILEKHTYSMHMLSTQIGRAELVKFAQIHARKVCVTRAFLTSCVRSIRFRTRIFVYVLFDGRDSACTRCIRFTSIHKLIIIIYYIRVQFCGGGGGVYSKRTGFPIQYRSSNKRSAQSSMLCAFTISTT